MKFNDLVRYILKEAPISDVQLDSEVFPNRKKILPANWEHAGAGAQVPENSDTYAPDYKMFNNLVFRKRLQAETAKNIPFNIKLIFKDTGHKAGQKEEYAPTPGVITFVVGPTGDFFRLSSNKKGAWIVGHKLGHALNELPASQQIISNELIPLLKRRMYKPADGRDYPLSWKHAMDLSNFKSVRADAGNRGEPATNFEYIWELVAQYVYYGAVTFKVGRCLPTQAIADKYGKIVTDMIYKMLQQAVGKVLFHYIEANDDVNVDEEGNILPDEEDDMQY